MDVDPKHMGNNCLQRAQFNGPYRLKVFIFNLRLAITKKRRKMKSEKNEHNKVGMGFPTTECKTKVKLSQMVDNLC